MEKVRYKHLNSYLKDKFGSRTLKVCVDGGFTCPNRDGKVAVGGCIFCGAEGAGDLIKYKTTCIEQSIVSQIKGFLNSYRGERAEKFIVYFQSFSNTYDTIGNLKKKYDLALSVSDKLVGLEVATRPDCINEEVASLLASYKDRYYVCVELGLQSVSDEIGRLINRGYTSKDFERAVEILKKYGIDIVAHIMVGLPNESVQDIENTINFVNGCAVNGVKLHSTYVMKNTRLEEMFLRGQYIPLAQDFYVDMVAKIISNLNPDIIIHRINADPPKTELVAPLWVESKKSVINAINKALKDYDLVQGDKKLKF